MSTLDTGLTMIRNASQRVSAANGRMGNAFKGWMPTGLYARALLIMIVPMVILQTVVAFSLRRRLPRHHGDERLGCSRQAARPAF